MAYSTGASLHGSEASLFAEACDRRGASAFPRFGRIERRDFPPTPAQLLGALQPTKKIG
jgi:hypothetical protein